jgi:hypothetical protein
MVLFHLLLLRQDLFPHHPHPLEADLHHPHPLEVDLHHPHLLELENWPRKKLK